jgi:hypothetical protein
MLEINRNQLQLWGHNQQDCPSRVRKGQLIQQMSGDVLDLLVNSASELGPSAKDRLDKLKEEISPRYPQANQYTLMLSIHLAHNLLRDANGTT